MALHLRLMPYFLWCLLKGNIFHNDAIDLLVILDRLLEYIMAGKLTMGDIEDFEELVDFFEKCAVCVEEYASFIKMTPKNHHLGNGCFKVCKT